MPASLDYPHIIKPAGETARLERHPRTRVAMIVSDYANRGWSAEEIVLQYPYLTLAEVHAVLGYYHDHLDEIDRELAAETAAAEHSHRTQPATPVLTRLRALKRHFAWRGLSTNGAQTSQPGATPWVSDPITSQP